MSAKTDFFDSIQLGTERVLTWRNRRHRIKREKQKAKNPVIDWVEAFLWAAGVVLLINQYLFQAYQIPSGSMMNTLLIGDRIFVNKLVYGPELLPGMGKLPSPFKPQREQVVIFENPSYISRGATFDIAQRVIYMLTLSLVDIDRDENGQPKAHFLIKRTAAMGGDRLTMSNGNMSIRFAGEDRFVDERAWLAATHASHTLNRLLAEADYPVLKAEGKKTAYADLGLVAPESVQKAAVGIESIRYPDYIAFERERLAVLRSAIPHDRRYAALLARRDLGWYVPESRIFVMGDNRDNSHDARYFGPVLRDKVLGEAMNIYWPATRWAVIR